MSALLTVPKAAKESGIPYATLLRLIHEEKLRAVRLPGRRSFLLDPVDLNALIEGSKTGTVIGTVSENDPAKIVENVASEKRSHRQGRGLAPINKYAWMNDFTKRRRGA